MKATFLDVAKIVTNWQSQGLKVGFVAISQAIHAGHLYLIEEAKKVCDKLVIEAGGCYEGVQDVGNYLAGLCNFPKNVIPISLQRQPLTSEMWKQMEELSDLVWDDRKEYFPEPSAEQIKDVVEEIQRYKDFYPNLSELDLQHDILIHLMWYMIDKYYFPIDVRVRCYKDGMWCLRQQVYWKEVMGRDYVVITPYRENGLAVDGSFERASPEKQAQLRTCLEGFSVEEEKEALTKRFKDTGWHIMNYEEYSGPLLKYVNPSSVKAIYVSFSYFPEPGKNSPKVQDMFLI